MDPVVEPSSRKVQLSSRLCCDPFEWIHSPLSPWQAEGNGWGARFQQKKRRKKERKKHLHPHDKVFHRGGAGIFERGPSFPHMVLINSWGPDFWKYGQHEVLKDFYLGITTPIKKNLTLLSNLSPGNYVYMLLNYFPSDVIILLLGLCSQEMWMVGVQSAGLTLTLTPDTGFASLVLSVVRFRQQKNLNVNNIVSRVSLDFFCIKPKPWSFTNLNQVLLVA